MIITKRHLSRRTVLKGLGVTAALPLLDAMTPAATALAKTAAKGQVRFVAIEMVHGAAGAAPTVCEQPLVAGRARTQGSDADVDGPARARCAISDHRQQHRRAWRRRSRRRRSAAIIST
jgi:hypothetical protein